MTDPDTQREHLLDRTVEMWESKTSRPITREEARMILENMVGFFNLLLKWVGLGKADDTMPELRIYSLLKEVPSDDV